MLLHLELHLELENPIMKQPRSLLAFKKLSLKVLGGASINEITQIDKQLLRLQNSAGPQKWSS